MAITEGVSMSEGVSRVEGVSMSEGVSRMEGVPNVEGVSMSEGVSRMEGVSMSEFDLQSNSLFRSAFANIQVLQIGRCTRRRCKL